MCLRNRTLLFEVAVHPRIGESSALGSEAKQYGLKLAAHLSQPKLRN